MSIERLWALLPDQTGALLEALLVLAVAVVVGRLLGAALSKAVRRFASPGWELMVRRFTVWGLVGLGLANALQVVGIDLSVLLGGGGGTFSDPIIVPAVFGADAATIESVRVGDFNGDGFEDLAASNPARGTVSIMLGFGDGGFAAPQTYDVSGRPHWIAAGDFNCDGIDDLAVVGNDSGFITTLTGFAHP